MFVPYFLSNNSCIMIILIGVKSKPCFLAFKYLNKFELIIIFWNSFTRIAVHHASKIGWNFTEQTRWGLIFDD